MTGNQIEVNLKFFAGIDKEFGLQNYDYMKGIAVIVRKGSRLRSALQKVGFKKKSYYTFFCNTEKVGQFYKLKNGDQISCLKPVGGG